ncbi:MAG: class I SAM-dependent RNA methyltransferase [Vicinamibacterales bacterium]
MEPGALIELEVAKPAAGGRMIGRHDGQVVLVWGAIPGERIRARLERVTRAVAYADTVEVLSASPDRRDTAGDWRCGGSVYAHVHYPRQRQLKAEILGDAFARIARLPIAPPEVVPSPERGYRMRARLHARGGRLGFFREGTHDLCDAVATGQLLPQTGDWIARVEEVLARERLTGLAWLELAENVAGDQRACHFEVAEGERRGRYAPLADLAGREIADTLHAREGDRASAFRLHRDARAFFQGNRFLLEGLAQLVVSLVPPGPVVDLYAGVGLFGLALAAAGWERVTLVEGDPVSSTDLRQNAQAFAGRARVERRSVESFLAAGGGPSDGGGTVIVDPPRTGLSRDALAGVLRMRPGRLIYVSCDPATLARDARAAIDGGYALTSLTGLDLFPNTAHVESVAVFDSAIR